MRWAILGAGRMGQRWAGVLDQSPRNELVAVGSRRGLDAWPDIGCGYEEAIDRADAVYIATTHPSHLHWAHTAVAASRHVLCEKPLSITGGADAQALFDAADAAGVVAVEGFMYLHHPQMALAVQLLDVLGTVRSVVSSFGFAADFDAQDRLFDPALGGSAIFDVGCYPASAAALFLGYDVTVDQAVSRHCATGVDDLSLALLRSPEGWANVAAATSANLPSRLTVSGDHGVLTIDEPWHPDAAASGVSFNGVWRPVTHLDAYACQLARFHDSVVGDDPPWPDRRLSVVTADLIAAWVAR